MSVGILRVDRWRTEDISSWSSVSHLWRTPQQTLCKLPVIQDLLGEKGNSNARKQHTNSI